MKKNLIINTIATVVLMFGSMAQASIILTPDDADGTSDETRANLEKSLIETLFSTSDLTLYYKSNTPPEGSSSGAGVDEEGTFASSYETTLSNTATDPEDAYIDYISGTSIACPECYLAVKDGNNSPGFYFFDLGDISTTAFTGVWNGTEDLDLQDFWPGNGAISHVSIWGKEVDGGGPPSAIPEPGMMALFGIGLMGMGLSHIRRRRKVS